MANLSIKIFFFNDTATTEIYTLSLHDALPICEDVRGAHGLAAADRVQPHPGGAAREHAGGVRGGAAVSDEDDGGDRKSTRLNSSHANISYAVFCLKKKKD